MSMDWTANEDFWMASYRGELPDDPVSPVDAPPCPRCGAAVDDDDPDPDALCFDCWQDLREATSRDAFDVTYDRARAGGWAD